MGAKSSHTPSDNILLALRRSDIGQALFVAVCLLTGLGAGTLAFVLKRLTAAISEVATDGVTADESSWRFLWLPVAGIVLAGCFQRYILGHSIEHATERIRETLAARRYLLPWTAIISPVAGASVTLGLGGSAGAEGPIAYTGAALGSNIARWLRLRPALTGPLLAIGAGAGIAGIFKAPAGGFFFTVEVLGAGMSALCLIGLATACIAAGLTAYILSGFTPGIMFPDIPPFDPWMMAWAVPLGLTCGLYSIYYAGVMRRLTAAYRAVGRPWVRWVLAGGVIALSVFLFPALFGEGYQVIADLLAREGGEALTFGNIGIHGWIDHLSPGAYLVAVATGAALFKAAASASTNSGGGVAGNFAPTIFAGAVVGFGFATLSTAILGLEASVPALVLMAMGGVMAGAVRAPVMAIFLVAEMSGALTLFLPLAITCAVSYLVVRWL